MAEADVEMNDVSLDEGADAEVSSDQKKEPNAVPIGPSIHFDNSIDLYEEICDAESGETVLILFGFLTTKDDEGDEKLEDMCSAMSKAGVFYHSYDAKSGNTGYRMTRVGATKTRLEKFADKIDFVKGLDRAKIKEACEEIGLVLKNPDYAKSWYDPYAHLSGGFEIEKKELFSPFTDGDYIKLLFLILVGSPNFRDDAKGCGFDLHKLNSSEATDAFCLGFFPLHEPEAKATLERRWLPLDWPSRMPIYDIKEYFGEEIAFYFAFLTHITSSLFPLVPFALAASVVTFLPGFRMYGEACFAIFGTCTYSIVLDSWRYNQSKLAFKWNVFGCLQQLPPRPGFRGIVMANPVTGDLEFEFPGYMRAPRKIYSFILSSTMIMVLVITVASIFLYKAILVRSGSSSGMLLVPALLNAVQITIFGVIYEKVATFMTHYENHRTVTDHNSELFKKLTLFYFVNNYATLFYIAFVKASFEGCIDPVTTKSTYCGLELSIQVAVVFLVNDFGTRMGNSVVLPFLMRRFANYRASNNANMVAANMGPIEKQYVLLSPYDPDKELILDYIELFIQWGYLTLFGASFPLVVLFASITNYVETRTDGNKLLNDYRRVIPNRVDGIGQPLNVFYYTLFCAVPVNAGLVVYTFKASPFNEEYNVWMLLAIGFFIVVVIGRLDVIYPDVPKKTQIQLEREEFIFDRVVLGNEARIGDLKLDIDESMIGFTANQVKAKLAETKPSGTRV